MTWKLSTLSALTSGGAVVVTALATLVSPIGRPSTPQAPESQALDRAGAVVDLGAQADRLKARLAEVTAYRQPGRDAFQFGPPPRRVEESVKPLELDAPPAVVAPARPPYGLAGMATTTENGVTQRTAILSSLQGVSLVKEGETLDTGYRVVSITEDAVVLESLDDGTQSTLRLSNTDQSR
jgi:hypothetical protein